MASMPYHYAAWIKVMLDERPGDNISFIDVSMRLRQHDEAVFDAVYCSQQLKNYSINEGAEILTGFKRLLKPGGFIHLKVPDVAVFMHQMVKSDHDLYDVAYVSAAGPISYHDVLWGLSKKTETNGASSTGHRSGYSRNMIERVLSHNGFSDIIHISKHHDKEVELIAAVNQLHDDYRIMLGLSRSRITLKTQI